VVKLYVEGGTKDSALERSLCRQAFSRFFAGEPGLNGKLPRTVPCGGRKAAYDAFVTAVNNPKPGELPLLLVDSETDVQQGTTVWDHLKSRRGDNWDKPQAATDDQAFLMVQVMETWFIADRLALKEYFGQKFRENSIPLWPDLEKVPKSDVYSALERASAGCDPKIYEKGRVSFDILAKTSPAKVQNASPHARALFDRLKSL
jgi:hypothetical protein